MFYTNENIKNIKSERVAVGSLDVTALYPSLDQDLSARIVKEEYIASEVKVKDID